MVGFLSGKGDTRILGFKGFFPKAIKEPSSKLVGKQEEERIRRFVEALASGSKDICEADVDKIITEAFPRFEATVGIADFQKVKKAYGIGVKTPQKNVKQGEIEGIMLRLKTIENAMYYLHGFAEIIDVIAAKLLNAPDDMDTLTRAKLVIGYYRIFFNQEQFVEDFVNVKNIVTQEVKVEYSEAQALKNHSKIFAPEEIFILYNNKVQRVNGIFYDAIKFEIAMLPKREMADVLSFAELQFDKEKDTFVSINKCAAGMTFGKIRALKKKVFAEHPYFGVESFANVEHIQKSMGYRLLYSIFKVLNTTPWQKTSEIVPMQVRTLTGSKFETISQNYYDMGSGLCLGGPVEAERWSNMFLQLSRKNFVMHGELPKDKEATEVSYYNMGAAYGAIIFANAMGYIGAWSTLDQDMATIDGILDASHDSEDVLIAYKDAIIDNVNYQPDPIHPLEEDVKVKLGITDEYALKHLQQTIQLDKVHYFDDEGNDVTEERLAEMGYGPNGEKIEDVVTKAYQEVTEILEAIEAEEKALTNTGDENVEATDEAVTVPFEDDMMMQALYNHALEMGYVAKPEELACDMLTQVVIENYEKWMTDFAAGFMTASMFEKKIGIPAEFASGLYNLEKLDMKEVESYLLDAKAGRHNAKKIDFKRDISCLVRLYSYVVMNSIPTGPKKKAPKGNKALKPKNLLNLLD